MRPAFLWLLVPLAAGCAQAGPPVPKPVAAREISFAAKDGGKVFADLYRSGPKAAGAVVLMFHQARSSAAEYYPIAPRVQKLGFECFAVDQRSGGDIYGSNRT